MQNPDVNAFWGCSVEYSGGGEGGKTGWPVENPDVNAFWGCS